jgi:hypothetical protein
MTFVLQAIAFGAAREGSNGRATDVTVITFILGMDHGMTLRVTRCQVPAQTGVLVTSRSRGRRKYPNHAQRQTAASDHFRFLAPGNTVILDSPCS